MPGAPRQVPLTCAPRAHTAAVTLSGCHGHVLLPEGTEPPPPRLSPPPPLPPHGAPGQGGAAALLRFLRPMDDMTMKASSSTVTAKLKRCY